MESISFRGPFIPLLIMGLVALFLALGRNNPLFAWVHSLPLFGQFRAPSKYLPGFIVPVAVLGAVGLSCLREMVEKSLARPGQTRYALGGGCVGIAGFVAVLFLPAIHFAVTPLGLTCRELLRSLSLLLLAGGILSINVRFGIGGEKGRGIRYTSLALMILALLDMGFYFKKYAVTAPSGVLRRFPVQLVKKHVQEGVRVLATPEVPHLNETIPAGISTPGGYDPFQVGIYMDEFRRLGIIQSGEIPDAWTPPVEIAANLSAGWVVTQARLQSPNLVPEDRDSNWFLYRVRNPRPFAEFVPAESTTPIVNGATVEPPLSTQWEGERLFVRGFVPKKGSVTLRQTYVPGWEWKGLDGEWRDVRLENPFWQSFEVDIGLLDIEMRYHPWGWVWGYWLHALGLIGLCTISTMGLWRRTP